MGKYENWLARLPYIGNGKKIELIKAYGSARDVFFAPEEDLAKMKWKKNKMFSEKKLKTLYDRTRRNEIDESINIMQEAGISLITYGENKYPNKLREICDSPYQIYYMGELPKEDEISVAIIGARECTAYGENIARRLGNALGKVGIHVVSGMARGVDGISQLAAIQAKGKSFGVLGSGVDICYPKENRGLYELLKLKGGILSEYTPGTEPRPNLFPARNRIISAMSNAIIVVESREKSGTRITVQMALEQGKDVYVVPGRITDGLSEGCNQLIKDGARIITSIDHFMQEFLLDMQYIGDLQVSTNKVFTVKERRKFFVRLIINPKVSIV